MYIARGVGKECEIPVAFWREVAAGLETLVVELHIANGLTGESIYTKILP